VVHNNFITVDDARLHWTIDGRVAGAAPSIRPSVSFTRLTRRAIGPFKGAGMNSSHRNPLSRTLYPEPSIQEIENGEARLERFRSWRRPKAKFGECRRSWPRGDAGCRSRVALLWVGARLWPGRRNFTRIWVLALRFRKSVGSRTRVWAAFAGASNFPRN